MKETPLKADGVRDSYLRSLKDLTDHPMDGGRLLDETTLETLCRITLATNREVLILCDDHNVIRHVTIGDTHTVNYDIDALRGNAHGLNRIRVIHTHPGGSPRLSDEDCSSAKCYRLQCMIAVGVSENGHHRFGIGLPVVQDEALVYLCGTCENLKQLNRIDVDDYAFLASKELRRLPDAEFDLVDTEERALLLGLDTGKNTGIDIDASMEELAQLVKTCNGIVTDRIIQNRPTADPVSYFGKGKLTEIARYAQNAEINLIVTNDELNANQIACIEAATGCKTVDRTTVILDIFARHAKTAEGKLQVELAQQKYRMSHLKGLGQVLSRTGGGIGTRGPGEKKLEIDRRHIRRQLDELQARLEQIDKNNAVAAAGRRRSNIRTVALVGYTNSGKSTLFNRLTDADVVSADALFVTLDATLRRIHPDYGRYLLSDTVGFIEKLPHDLITAFRTTLKETENADLLLHIVDASNPDMANQIAVVQQVLEELHCAEKPIITVYNKIDKLDEEAAGILHNKIARRDDAACISAKKGIGIETLMVQIQKALESNSVTLTMLIPYNESGTLSLLHDHTEILSTAYEADGTKIIAILDGAFAEKHPELRKYAV